MEANNYLKALENLQGESFKLNTWEYLKKAVDDILGDREGMNVDMGTVSTILSLV